MPTNKQRRYQLDHEARGLCTQCSEKAVTGAKLCESHLLKSRRTARKTSGSRPWRAGGPGRPPKA